MQWHHAHARACGCREIPQSIVEELRRRGRTSAATTPARAAVKRTPAKTRSAKANPAVTRYIGAQPKPAQGVLRRVRAIIRDTLPDAEEVISYRIPAYRVAGRVALYFAGWKDHYSLYPATGGLAEAFAKPLAAYEVSKGTIRFPLAQPVPERLIARIARFRAKLAAEGATKKKRRTRAS